MKTLVTICAVIILFSPGYAWAGTWTAMPDIPGQAFIDPSGASGGTIVGTWGDGSTAHGFIYNGGSFTSLEYPGESGYGRRTNFYGMQGNIVVGSHGDGWSFDGLIYNISTQAWTNVVSPFPGFPYMHDLCGIEGDKLVGSVWDGQQYHGQCRAIFYDGTSWSIIQPSGSPSARAEDISGNTIVGQYTDSSWVNHGFIYDGTNWTTVNGPGATSTALQGISGSFIVGYTTDASNAVHGLLYNGTAWMTLDMPGATYTNFTGIDGSTVVGCYTDASGMSHGLNYTIPEPATLTLLVLGGLMLRKK